MVAVIEHLRSSANVLEAQLSQLQNLVPPSAQAQAQAQMQPMSMFQMYHPHLPVVAQQQPQQQQLQHHQLPSPASGGLKREADRQADDGSGVPIKKRRRRRRRNSAGILVDGDTLLENGDHPHGRRRGPKAPADPNRPKRPASAYLIFQNEVRRDMQAAYPDRPYHEILGKISERWNQLTDAEKKHYTDITVAQKVQYEKDKARYEAERNGVPGSASVPPSAGSIALVPSAGVLPDVPISTGLVPVSAAGTSDADEEDDDEASEASAALQGHEDDEDDEDGEDD